MNGLGMLLQLRVFLGSERTGHYRPGDFTGPHDEAKYMNMYGTCPAFAITLNSEMPLLVFTGCFLKLFIAA